MQVRELYDKNNKNRHKWTREKGVILIKCCWCDFDGAKYPKKNYKTKWFSVFDVISLTNVDLHTEVFWR